MIERPVTFGSFTFNDQSLSDLMTSPYYWIKITNVDGIFGDDIRFESHDIAGSDFSRSAPPLRSGKQLVLTGEIWAPNLSVLRTGEWALQEAFWSTSATKFYFQPWPVYIADATEMLYFTVLVNQPLVITDEFSSGTGQMKQLWTVGLHADDGRPYRKSDDSLFFSWQM